MFDSDSLHYAIRYRYHPFHEPGWMIKQTSEALCEKLRKSLLQPPAQFMEAVAPANAGSSTRRHVNAFGLVGGAVSAISTG